MAKVKVHAGDFGKSGSSSLSSKGAFTLWPTGKWDSEQIPANQIETVEIASEESVKRFAGAVGLGLAGAALLGPLGLLAGVLAGGSRKEVTFIVQFKDGRRLLGTTTNKAYTKLQASLFNRTRPPAKKSGAPGQLAEPGKRPKPVSDEGWNQLHRHKEIQKNLESLNRSWGDLQLDRGLSVEASYRVLLIGLARNHRKPFIRKMANLYLAQDAFQNDSDPTEYRKRAHIASLDEIEEDGSTLGVTHVRVFDESCCLACSKAGREVLSITKAREASPLPRADCTNPPGCICLYEMVIPDEP